METILDVEGLTKRYGRAEVVSQLSLTIGRGQSFGILGPNGSGKTTTLAMVLGAVRPSAGKFRWFGQEPSPAHRRRIGAILERPAFSPYLSARANLKIVAAIRKVEKASGAIEHALDLVNLSKLGSQDFRSYSLGMQQRLAIASALLGAPEVLVLDEPTNGIDATGIAEIRQAIQNLAAAGHSIILASHILDEVEKLCTHVAVFSKGKVQSSGAIADVLRQDDGFELAADDMERLGAALQLLQAANPTITSVVRRGHHFYLQGGTAFSSAALNAELHAKGVSLSHLAAKRKSLESHFLEVLGQDKV